MENAHRETVKNLFGWWNWHVFSFETVPGKSRKDDDGFDSGMDEAEAALNSDVDFSDGELGGQNFGDNDDRDGWYQADQPRPALQMSIDSHPDDISINLLPLAISERSVAPLDPVVAPVHAIIVPWVGETTFVHSAGVVYIMFFTSFASNLFDD